MFLKSMAYKDNKYMIKESILLKIDKFKDQMIKELESNSYKGSIDDFKNFDSIISELEYHKAKLLLAIRLDKKQAVKEYIADTANFLFALGDIGGLYDDDFEDSTKSFEINKEVDIFVEMDLPSDCQSICNSYITKRKLESVEFIKNKLDYLVSKYPNSKYNYEFNQNCGSHYIEVKPNKFYELDPNLKEDEKNIISDFLVEYPYDGITFFSKSDFIQIENSTYEVIGSKYDNLS